MEQLVTHRESTRYPGLFVRKYTRKVFYDNLWTDDLKESRGHVVDASGNLVINPFTKIFNRHENETDIDLEEEVLAVEKINGFMAAVTYIPSLGRAIVSTTGSLDSEYVDMAVEMIPNKVMALAEKMQRCPITLLFEIVHPNDPHIIQEVPGVYLIGYRSLLENTYSSSVFKEKVADILAHGSLCRVMRPTWQVLKFRDIVQQAKTSNREGFVVYGKTTTLKIKTPFYLIHKFLGRLSKNKMRILETTPLQLKAHIDEEFYPLLDHLILNRDQFLAFNEQARISYITDFLMNTGELNEH